MKVFKNYLMITLSIFIMAVGVYFFKFPNNFCFGGVTGFAVVAAKLLPISAGNFTFVVNSVLLILGFIFLGKSFAIKTTYASVLLSLLLVWFERIYPMSAPFSDQPVLELIFAISLPAIGSAILFQIGASSGGTDVIAMIVKKYSKFDNIALALFLTDLVMIIVACFVFDIETALYSFVGLTIKSFMIEGIIESINQCKSITIICDEVEPICDYIMDTLDKSATITDAVGAYSHQKKYIVFTTLTRSQALDLRNYIHQNGLNAFISVSSTSEVFGKGFTSI
jgi:uncharacterized membrane-anchored protein YitT (DUF2179 family)